MIARDLMTPNPLTVTPQASIAEAWDVMRELAVRHVPVVEDGALVGMLSDRDLALVRALRLPTFEYPATRGGPPTLVRRMAWFVERGAIERIWYPVFPPDRNAETVLGWLGERARLRSIDRGEVRLA